MAALQHLADLTVFGWAGERAVSKKGYAKAYRAVAGLPATPFHMDVDTAREEHARWMLNNSLAALLRLNVAFVEDIRKICGLVAFNAAKASSDGDLPSLAAEINTPCVLPDLPSRLDALKARYAVPVPLEDELRSLHDLHVCLAGADGGIVAPWETLTLRLVVVQPPDRNSPPELGDYRRSWQGGEFINLSDAEHAAMFTTFSVFMSAMLETVQTFAKNSGLTETIPAMSA